jgi:FKBP-type peptidyl-prolyl cis-trans isomerase
MGFVNFSSPALGSCRNGSLLINNRSFKTSKALFRKGVYSLVSCKSCLKQNRRDVIRSLLQISLFSLASQWRPFYASAALRQLQFDKDKHQLTRTASGLEYFDIKCGQGPFPQVNDLLVVRYTSRLQGLNGWKLDSSEDHEEPLSILYNEDTKKNFVPGFWEALSSMRPGGKRRAIVPPKIGYRSVDDEPRPISWDARRRLLSVLNTYRDKTIVFDIELKKVIPYHKNPKITPK